jgi:hypothetical protein
VFRSVLPVLLLLAILTEGSAMTGDSESGLHALVDALPAELHGWRKAEPEFHDARSLYRYINGGAELYIAFQFATMVSQPYVDAEGDEMRLDLFDMGSAAQAFGVFCHSRETVDRFVAPDVESEYGGGLLHFWKDRYYGSMLGYPETETRRAVLQELARAVTARIGGDSTPPALVAMLGVDGLDRDTVRYFRHPAWIDDYHRFGDDNPLGIDADTEVAMGKIRLADGARPAVLVVVRYPDEARAKAAETTVAADGPRQDADGRWLGCTRDGELLTIVAAASDRATAVGLLRQAENQRRGP